MVAVCKVGNIDPRSTPGDIRKLFKEHGARPEDIHIASRGNGKRSGCAFLIFNEPNDADNALRVDGRLLNDCRISVRTSNPKEFDKNFPGVSMISRGSSYARDTRSTGVLKVENVDLSATPGDIRRFFKDHGARPEDIHLVIDSDRGKHNGCAFLIFNDLEETENALKLEATVFRDHRISVKRSNPKEFDRYFPRVPMITKPISRGRGINRGIVRGHSIPGRNIPRSITHLEGRSHEIRSSSASMSQLGRGRPMRGGRLRGISRRGSGRFSGDHFYDGGRGPMNIDRNRSRSPITSTRREDPRESFLRNFSGEQLPPYDSGRVSTERRSDFNRSNRSIGFPSVPMFDETPLPNINERKFLRIYGLPSNASEVDIQDFFRPVLTRDIYVMRNPGGKFNGSAVVEFFSESDARQAIKMDGKKFGRHTMSVIRPGKDDIERTIQESAAANGIDAHAPTTGFPDFSAMNTVAESHPQVQHLLNLLTATVNTLAGAAAAAVQGKPENKREYRNDRLERNRDDPVISRVATSANIDVSDIKLGRVVGIRNLPFSVTPDEILKFFHGYHAISDSVRIHYLEDGRCSGDAIICFRGNRDARKAVSDLNKGTIGRRKVELFFL